MSWLRGQLLVGMVNPFFSDGKLLESSNYVTLILDNYGYQLEAKPIGARHTKFSATK